MRASRFLIIAAFLVSLSSPAHAALVTIDFEGFVDGDILTTQIPDVTFSDSEVLTDGSVGGNLNEIDFPPVSPFNVLFDSFGPITITFAAPVANFSAYLSHNTALDIAFFDASLNMLGTFSSAGPVLGISEHVVSALSGIASVIITGNPLGGSFTLDDVSFETTVVQTPIPEPATLTLLGAGLVSLAYRRRKLGGSSR